MGLITAETIANGVANGIVPPDQTVAAEKAPAGSPNSAEHQLVNPVMQSKSGSPRAKIPTTIPEEKPVVDGPPAQYFDQPPSDPTPGAAVVSPLPTPGNGYFQATPLSGYDDFMQASKEGSEESSPRFMLDWTQMPMPMGFDPMSRSEMIVGPDMGFDPHQLSMMPHGDGMLTIMPDLPNTVSSLITPIETPKMERAFGELELGSSAAMYYPHGRQMSCASISSGDNHEIEAIVAAQDGWNVFRCIPTIPSSSCPTTAKQNLERLEQTLRNHEGWSAWTPPWDESDFSSGEPLTVMQLHESTRDKLLAITQSFLHRALETHRGGSSGSQPHGQSPQSNGGSNFVLLPPGRVLEYFLRSYANSFEKYYALTSRGVLDANELMHCYNDKASSLLILMMIAQGAMNIPSAEARWLTGGLTEACRISLFDLIERNISMASDPIALHSALLFTVQAAWSGDKWQMDIAMGQRGMYSYMLRHSGVLENRPVAPTTVDHRASADSLWSEWIQHESRSRLVALMSILPNID